MMTPWERVAVVLIIAVCLAAAVVGILLVAHRPRKPELRTEDALAARLLAVPA